MSVADAKAALKACEDGIALMTAQQKSNEVLTSDYNSRLASWESRKTTHNNNWGNSERDRQNAQASWDTRYNEWYSHLRKVYNAGCGLCGSNPGCPGGSNDVGNDGCETNCVWFGWPINKNACTAGCNRRCQKNEETARNESITNTNNERGGRPGNYNEPKFSESEPVKPAQNLTPINIACCANTVSIVGSQVDSNKISQQNDCLQNKQAAVATAETAAATKAAKDAETAKAAAAAAETAKDAKTTTQTTVPQKATSTSTSTSTELTKSNNPFQNKYIIMIVLAIIVFSLSSSSVLVLLVSSSE